MATKYWREFFGLPPKHHNLSLEHLHGLRCGENARVRAHFYAQRGGEIPTSLGRWQAVGPLTFDKDVSANALNDLERSLGTMLQINMNLRVNGYTDPYISAGSKHANACGAAIGQTPEQALHGMGRGDSRALYGAFVIMNFPLTGERAAIIHEYTPMISGVAAPEISEEAHEELFRRSRALVALQNPALANLHTISARPTYKHLPLLGGVVVEEPDTFALNLNDPEIECWGNDQIFGIPEVCKDILLADAVCRRSNSNTITFARNGMVAVNAVGGQDRVGQVELAGWRAKKRQKKKKLLPKGTVFASDSFFPFPDGLEELWKHGVRIGFTTRGGQNNAKVREFVENNSMSVLTLPDNKARGFFGHR